MWKRLPGLPSLLALCLALSGCRSTAAPPAPDASSPVTPEIHEGFSYHLGDERLDRLQVLIRDTLERNRRDIDGMTGRVTGYGAGTIYPQLWLRDSATLIEVSRYVCSRECLTTWIEEHLAHQRPDGSLYDWIAAGAPETFRRDAPQVVEAFRAGDRVISADRNTAATDQEASAIDAASQVFTALGDRAWLRKPVADRPLIDRLDDALSFVAERLTHRPTGLVTSAFSADWGDVAPVHKTQLAIYLDERTPVVVSLYSSAMFVRAATRLAALQRAVGNEPRGLHWARRASAASHAINRELWQERRGFYRMQRPLGASYSSDGGIFALGGNTAAMLERIADDARTARIVATVLARRQSYGMPTISGVLLPAFDRDVFGHPLLNEPYTYQNGGLWNWWGGRFLLAAFERGHAEMAYRELERIAEQAVDGNGLYEWWTRDGEGRGSSSYAGSGGALGAAILRGLFGVYLRGDGLDLTIRLGGRSGSIHVQQPADGAGARYAYAYDADRRTARLDYQASVAGTGTLSVLLPPGTRHVTAVLNGGSPFELPVKSVGRDRYAWLQTDWWPQQLDLTFR